MKRLLILILVALASHSNAQNVGYEIGAIAADFSLKNVDGKMVSLSNYTDAKGFFVVFTCNHCPYSKAYESRIIDLDKKYAAKGYPVIAINPNNPTAYPEDSFEMMQKVAKSKKYPFPYLVDETQDVTKVYGAKVTPHVYLLNKTKDGLKVAYIGAIDNDIENINAQKILYAEDAVNALIVGKKPGITQTKAIGCGVKWK